MFTRLNSVLLVSEESEIRGVPTTALSVCCCYGLSLSLGKNELARIDRDLQYLTEVITPLTFL